MRKSLTIVLMVLIVVISISISTQTVARVSGRCDNCHTMHNSQDGESMFSEPSDTLLKGECIACHSSSESSTTYMLGTSKVPVVNSTGGNPVDYLAGGNFFWVNRGHDAKGHNVYGIAAPDKKLDKAPGNRYTCGPSSCHATLAVKTAVGDGDRAGGCQGCHLNVAHHANDGTGTKYVGSEEAGWYRFLSGHMSADGSGVAGIEHKNWSPFSTAYGSDEHNEYLGSNNGYSGLRENSMTAFCCGCHGNFHVEQRADGGWVRHPSDFVIPNSYNLPAYYDQLTPLARSASTMKALGDNPSRTVEAGVDMVMCLSCHRAHGSPYDDMLRWDYAGMIAGDGGVMSNRGCFYCHTAKDGKD